MLDLDICWEEDSVPELEREKLSEQLERGINEAIRLADGPKEAEVSLTLTDDTRIWELNRTYRGVDRPTDVLSFALLEQDEEEPEIIGLEDGVLGDIVISIERARAQAVEYGHSFNREVLYLAVHGTLHLLGYDHGEEKEKTVMRQKEEEVLACLHLSRE
ncbi:MAG: rRNA maturation RNase YbeY [Desulfitobacteriaceae bacterium]